MKNVLFKEVMLEEVLEAFENTAHDSSDYYLEDNGDFIHISGYYESSNIFGGNSQKVISFVCGYEDDEIDYYEGKVTLYKKLFD